MVTRKSGDGSRSADVGSDRPGSYVKVSGSRRRRKGRRGSTIPPSAAVAPDQARIVDTVAETEDERTSDLGDDAVDDLRRGSKPASNRPRNELGPLGIDDIRSDPPANTLGSDRPRESLRVVEINASEQPRSKLFDDEDDEVDEADRELARQYEIDDASLGESDVRASARPQAGGLVLRDPFEAEESRQSLSSVLGARASLRPSPPPEGAKKDAASVLWWLVVASLVAIIAAAGAIAAREQFGDKREVAAPEPVAPERPAPAAERIQPPPVSFGTPQTIEAKPEATPVDLKRVEAKPSEPRQPASPSPPTVVQAAHSAAVRAGAAGTSHATGATSALRPSASGPAASAVKPSAEVKPKPKPAPSYAPGYGKSIEGASYAPGYNPSTPEPSAEEDRAKPSAAPAAEAQESAPEGLPINPYE
jgi:hypothetical protein